MCYTSLKAAILKPDLFVSVYLARRELIPTYTHTHTHIEIHTHTHTHTDIVMQPEEEL